MQIDPTQPSIQASTVISNIGQLVTIAQQPIAGATGVLQVISDAAIAVHDGVIVWIGPNDHVEPMFQQDTSTDSDGIIVVDAQGDIVTPGFVDSHTHLVFAGDRAEEFHLRRAGVSYGELLKEGRGILTTVNATRGADTELLTEMAITRLHTMCHYGTTTVEAKTGYGSEMNTAAAWLPHLRTMHSLKKTNIRQQKHHGVVR